MRRLNERLLLERLRTAGGPLSRSELAAASGLSKPTVALALAGLEQDELVQDAGRRAGARGRTALLYELNREAGFVVGLDAGHELVRGAVADLGGAVRVRGSGRSQELAAFGDELLRDAGARRETVVLQAVVGTPGVVEPDELRRLLGDEVVLESDVAAAAVAEREHGLGRDVSTFAFVSVGAGIRIALVIEGKLHRGAHGAARGIAFPPPDGGGSDLPAAEAAARALASVVAVVDPELIVLGGDVGTAPGFAGEVAERLAGLAAVVPGVRPSALGDEAVVDGCLALGGERLWQRVLDSRADQ